MHFQEKEIKDLKWMSDEALHRAEKRKLKGNGERERYLDILYYLDILSFNVLI